MWVALLASSGVLAATDDGVIRLRPSSSTDNAVEQLPDSGEPVADARRGFDYESFETRLESLWFQRKTLLADGRFDDVAEQSELIRAFCAEEGVHRLESMAAALVAEADRLLDEGRHDEALESLALAESLDPGRPQIRMARAAVLWRSDRSAFGAGTELLAALRAAFVRGLQDLTLFNQLALVLVVALAGCVLLFVVLMLVRYQVPFRHEVEERVVQVVDDRWAMPAGWAALFLPMLLWLPAGWAVFYWMLVTYRFMRRSERAAALTLLAACVLAQPAYRMAVNVYAMSADPAVRTTLASAGGEYDPDRVLKLQQLVRSYPNDPVYRFLLAGLYKNGRYFEEAFAEYKQALELDPTLEEAHINIGNIFFTTGQYNEAVASYGRALEINPRSILAYFDQHLTQSESFRFKEAEASLQSARQLDPRRLAEMLTLAGSQSDRPTVLDAEIQMASVWEAALEGRTRGEGAGGSTGAWLLRGALNPISLVALVTLVACLASGLLSVPDSVARRCIRCGRPFCHHCKSGREGREYCSQCLHLFVLGDGLARETKNRKMYEVERYERWTQRIRRLVSLVLPGAAQLLRGRAGPGTLLLLFWVAGWIAWQPVLLVPVERYAGIGLRPDLLAAYTVPNVFSLDPFSALGLLVLTVVWISGNAWRWRTREA